MYKKKLIEVALPLDAINAASAREKSIRHGHPSTLHLWWSRKPTATARAVIWASLVDDPSSNPGKFPTEEEQKAERERLFKILEELVIWENSNDEEVLEKAKAEILRSTNGNPPTLFDPFAGGGSIPLEAQRLGLTTYASDLNPVSVMINKAMIEIPPKFSDCPPVNPVTQKKLINNQWKGTNGLAQDVRYYGSLIEKRVFEKIGHLYPDMKLPNEFGGKETSVIAYIWMRTVKCPNPACGCSMPLTSNFALSRRPDRKAYIHPTVSGNKVHYTVRYGEGIQKGTVSRSGARCICCGQPVNFSYIREEGKAHRIGQEMVAIVLQGKRRRVYVSATDEQKAIAMAAQYSAPPEGDLGYYPGYINPVGYGITEFKMMFTNRQLAALTTFRDQVPFVLEQIVKDASECFDNIVQAQEYGDAVVLYLALAINRLANRLSNICIWNATGEKIEQTFGMQGIQMTWNYAEANVFSGATGSWRGSLEWIPKCIERLPSGNVGHVYQLDARSNLEFKNILISTDPPYYDSIIYANFSDFFYVWMRGILKNIYPEIFNTLLSPKDEELIVNPNKYDGDEAAARAHFESGMYDALLQMYNYSGDDAPTTIYYAYKQRETDENENVSSTGWEAMLTSIIRAGFVITATWPIRTERPTGHKASENALASSIVLVCRKRSKSAPISTRRDFINALRRELKPALKNLQVSNIAPVDMAQSAIGPGMAVYSRYSKVLEANGEAMTVRSALQVINQELDLYFSDQDGELDSDSRFCVDLYTQYAFNEMRFGEADVLARAKNTSVEGLVANGVLHAQKGVVRLLTREEIPKKIDRKSIWLLTQQLTHAFEKDGIQGVAKIVADIHTSEPERARALAYRLYTISERKGWASEAYAYNSLVTTWRDIQAQAGEMQARLRQAEQGKLF